MKLAIVGLPGSGKATVFEALTRSTPDSGHQGEMRIATIRVPDQRVDVLSDMYNPKKTVHARVEYFLPAMTGHQKERNTDHPIWSQVRDADALVHVVRNFCTYGFSAPKPEEDFLMLDQELMLADLLVVEKRVERLETDQKRGKKINAAELTLLNECRKNLENETPLRRCPDLASAQLLKGYAFVSAKPVMVLFNNEDEDDNLPAVETPGAGETCELIRGKLEQELAQMTAQEASDFLSEFNIAATATDRIIRGSYELLNLISFFTVGEDEVRAWTVTKEVVAVDAAGVIHTDFKKGFIRAEVLSYTDLLAAGSCQEARKRGTVRLEGKTYVVQDGDIINFRFNV